MTGLQKTLLFGGVAAFGAAAFYLSKLKKNIETTFGFPTLLGLVNGRYVRLIIPADIFNYTGFGITLNRFRIKVKYIDDKGAETLLGISPTVIPTLVFKGDIKTSQKFELDIDPLVVFNLKSTTPIKIYTEFDWFRLPVSIPVQLTVNDIVPVSTIGKAINTLLNKIGIHLKLNGLGCACDLPKNSTPILPTAVMQGIWNLQGTETGIKNAEVL